MNSFKVEIASERSLFGKINRDYSVATLDGREVARIYSGNGLSDDEAEYIANRVRETLNRLRVATPGKSTARITHHENTHPV